MRKFTILFSFCFLFCALAGAAKIPLLPAKKFPLTAAPIVPAATGRAEVGADKNGNSKVKITVEHLAKPEHLTPPKNAYVVWFQETGGTPEAEGQLKVNKNLKTAFETTTPWKNFQILITAEDDPTAKTPSGPEVLRTAVTR
jgi:hypothetical protein